VLLTLLETSSLPPDTVWKSGFNGGDTVLVAAKAPGTGNAGRHVSQISECRGLAVYKNTLIVLTPHSLKKFDIASRWNQIVHAIFPSGIKGAIKAMLLAKRCRHCKILSSLPKEILFNIFSFVTAEVIEQAHH
jgi:uncharacterized membrane protein